MENRARWLRGNARDSHSGGPGFKSRGRPTWLRFSGFLNLKYLRNYLFFSDKCRVGPHIPLLLIQYFMFTVSRDMKPLLSKWWLKFPNRWQCNLMGLPVSWLISSVVVRCLDWTRPCPGDYIGHGPTDVSHDRWGCLSSWLFTSRSWPGDYIGHGPTDVSHNRWGCLSS